MKHEQAIELLNDYLDDSLAAERRSELEEHIAVCPDCRRELADLRALLASAAELPASIEPGRDLWSGIESDIAADRGVASENDEPRGRFPILPLLRQRVVWVGLAAAAILLLIWLGGGEAPEPHPEMLADAGEYAVQASGVNAAAEADAEVSMVDVLEFSATGMIEAMEAECRQGELDLQARVASTTEAERRSGALNTIVKNLKIIDSAIDEAKTAWRENPRSPHLARMVMAAYRAKASLLGKSARGTSI